MVCESCPVRVPSLSYSINNLTYLNFFFKGVTVKEGVAKMSDTLLYTFRPFQFSTLGVKGTSV